MNTIFYLMVITSLRDKISLFYSLLFPIALIIGLGLYFNDGSMELKILTGVTAISTLFWGMQGIAFQIHYQRNKGVYKLLKITPMPILTFIIIITLARTLIGVVINMIVWFSGVMFLNIDISIIVFLFTLLLVTIGTFCFSSIGFLIANLANNEGQISMYSNLIQLPMIFISEAFYSLESAPGWIQVVGKLLPFDYYVKGLQGSITNDHGYVFWGLIIPIAYMICVLLLSALTFKWEDKQSSTLLSNKMRS